jgi:anaerobic nitric oxide reductase flavorubredoxin
MRKEVRKGVYWVGKVDWELKKFHGEEYSTHRGSSYNSYVVEDEKVALIDTVWGPYAKDFVDNLDAEIGLSRIDYVVANHGERDHSGALPELMRRMPGVPIYCTANAVKSLKGQYHEDWNFQVVKTGDSLSLGKRQLVFVEAPLLHWPDSMMCYLTGDAVLFSNDAFGQHYATELLFDDLVDQAELFAEAIKYYGNILTPFSALVTRKIEEFVSLKLPLEVICPSHGVIWRSDPMKIVKRYLEWAADYREDRIALVYDTMWEGTRRLAEGIARGITEASPSTTVVIHNSSKSDKNDIITEVFRSKALLFGSPTINKGIQNSLAGLLEEVRGLGFKGKKAAAFGCYGWSGESVGMISKALEGAGFALVDQGLKALWNPDGKALAEAAAYGKAFAAKVR